MHGLTCPFYRLVLHDSLLSAFHFAGKARDPVNSCRSLSAITSPGAHSAAVISAAFPRAASRPSCFRPRSRPPWPCLSPSSSRSSRGPSPRPYLYLLSPRRPWRRPPRRRRPVLQPLRLPLPPQPRGALLLRTAGRPRSPVLLRERSRTQRRSRRKVRRRTRRARRQSRHSVQLRSLSVGCGADSQNDLETDISPLPLFTLHCSPHPHRCFYVPLSRLLPPDASSRGPESHTRKDSIPLCSTRASSVGSLGKESKRTGVLRAEGHFARFCHCVLSLSDLYRRDLTPTPRRCRRHGPRPSRSFAVADPCLPLRLAARQL